MNHTRYGLTACATAALISAITAFPAEAQKLPPTITMGSSQLGTLQHTLAIGLAKVASQSIGSTVVVTPFAGATTLSPLLNSGEIDLGIAPSTDMAMSYNGPALLKIDGQNPYPLTKNIRVVMSGAPLIASLIVRKDSPLRSAKDLRGHKIAGEFRASLGAFINTYAQLASAGLTWKDVTITPFAGLNESLDALTQGRIDATVFGVGAARVREADAQTGVRFISSDCSPEGLKRIEAAAPGYYTINLKAGRLPGVHDDLCTTAYDLYLIASTNTPDAVITAVLKSLWDHNDELAKMHPLLRQWTRAKAVVPRPTAPYHDAAIAFYKSVGAWTPEADAEQKRLLSIHKK